MGRLWQIRASDGQGLQHRAADPLLALVPFQEMHLQRRVVFPIVNTGCEFFRPCHLGDTLVLELRIARLGRSSIEFDIRGRARMLEYRAPASAGG